MASHRQIGVAVLSCLLTLFSTSTGYSGTPDVSQPNPVPLVNTPLVPDSAAPGGPDFKLTVNGTGFVSGSVVRWNGAPLATNFVTNSQLTATVPAADIAAPGTADVSVMSPSPGGGVSNEVLFDVRAPFSAASFGRTDLQVGSEPDWIIAADLNGDGKLDLAATLFKDSAVAILLGNGDGTFQSPVAYRVAGPAIAVLASDFNDDGFLDLAVSTWGDSVSILLGVGDGTFQSRRDLDLGNDSEEMLVAVDFNRDGKLDLAVVLDPGFVAVLLGNGDGTFQPAVDYPIGADRAFGLALGDFNVDGKVDLAVTAFTGIVSVLLGNGDGTFQGPVQYATKSGATSLVCADFNGDGILDVAVETEFTWLSVLLGNGDGTFQSHVDYLIQPGVYGMAVADLNGDGKLDLIIPGFKTLSTLLGRGDGTFWNRSDFATGERPLGILVGDFDGDGRFDIATANYNASTVSLLPQVTSVLSRTYLKFGNVKVGDTSTRKVTLTNIGDTSFSINRITIVGSSSDGYTETNNCGSKLAPGASCKITIVFAPARPILYRHARVKISDTAANVPQKIYLVGTGVN